VSTQFKAGDRVGGFSLLNQLTTGEFGETWLCENEITKRRAVLKGLKREIFESLSKLMEEFDIVTRSKEEAKIVSALEEYGFPFVARVYDVVEISDGRIFFLTEYVDGKMLRDWVIEEAIEEQTRANVAYQLLESLTQLHDQGIIHRDIAGDNVIVTKKERIKIIDFGLAKIKREILVRKYSSKTVSPFTKIKYMPPKAFIQREAGKKVETTESWDLYACGILFAEIFSGEVFTEPGTEISDEMIEKLPCPATIRFLLENGRSDDAPGGEEILKTFIQELRQIGLTEELAVISEESTLVQNLNQEIRQLQDDLAAKRGKTVFSDLVSFMSRTGLIYKVVPKKKLIMLNYNSDKAGELEFVIDARDDKVLDITATEIRHYKKRQTAVLQSINKFNWNVTLLKATFDPQDGECRLSLSLPHANTSIPYEEFKALLYTTIQGAILLAEKLDNEFISKKPGSS